MTCVVFLIFGGIIMCCLPACEGGIVSPPEGTIYTFLSGSTGNLTWIFDDEISTLVLRAWYFTRSGGSTQELLATIHDDNVPKIRPSDLSGVEIVKPATLVLRHVNQSYDGKYRFRIIGSSNQDVDIRVSIAIRPTVPLNCTNFITLNEGDDVTCECGGGNPPFDVSWYKDDKKIGGSGTGTENEALTLKNVDETASGIYMCSAQIDSMYEDNKTIVVRVNFKPRETSIRFSQNPVKLGDSVTIKCESRGFPEPSYAITLNGTTTVSAEKTYTIQKVMWNDTGTYECTATNTRGSDLVSALLDVTSKIEQQGPTTQPLIANSSSEPPSNSTTPSGKAKAAFNRAGGTGCYIVILSFLSGIITGIFLP